MKKIFSFLAAMLIASTAMFAGENLFNKDSASITTWFANANWQEETQSTAVYDTATGVITVNIAVDKAAQWQAQVKLDTKLTNLDPEKQYDMHFDMESNATFYNITAKMFDNAVMYDRNDLYLIAGSGLMAGAGNMDGVVSNGIFVFDFGYAPAGAVITISNIVVEESENYIHNCKSIMNLDNNATFTFGAFDVVYVNGRYTYIKDAKGTGLIYKQDYGLAAGDHVAAGLQGKLSIYNNLYEIVPNSEVTDLYVTHNDAPGFAIATELPKKENMNAVVMYKNVHFDTDVTLSSSNKNAKGIWGANNDTLVLYNQFGLDMTFEAGKEYNIVAANSVFKTTYQAYPISSEEYSDPYAADTVDHGLYNPANAAIDHTYFATHGWAPDAQSYAELVEGRLMVHIALAKSDHWQSQVFLNPGFEWTMGKYYRMEFDLLSSTQLGGVDIKVNDSDEKVWYHSYPNDNVFLAEQDIHYVADSIAVDALADGHGLIVFGFGWVAEGTEIFIHNIRIVEIGDYVPAETHMYIKHPWGTGADADWTWQEMTEETYGVYDAYVYEGKWGGVGCNIADNAEGNNAAWYAADKIQFLSPEELVLAAPEVGTDAKFVYIPALKDSEIVSPMKVIYTPTALDIINADVTVEKVMIDGKVMIIRNGVRYNMLGAEE